MIKNKKTIKLISIIGVVVLLVGLLAGFVVYSFAQNKVSKILTTEEAQKIVDETFESLPGGFYAKGAQMIIDNTDIKVLSVKEGLECNLELECSYSALDVKTVATEHKQHIIDSAYENYKIEEAAGKTKSSTKIRQKIADTFAAFLETAEPISGTTKLYLYEVTEGNFVLYLSDEAVDTCTGGLISVKNMFDSATVANYGGTVFDITNDTTVTTGINQFIELRNYDSEKPITGNFLVRWIAEFKDEFYRNFIEGGKWKYLLEGLGTTLAITGVAGLIGVLLGFIIAIIRCTCQTTGKFKIADAICRFYLTVIRGTPVMVQLLIIFFVILLPMGIPKFTAAVICFGLNSGAYVAEIVRGGIMSVDKGQNEAGRSLGFNFPQTMWHFIVPQAFKAVLPALANEFITLLKESSVAFYIGVADLTQGGLKIRSITYSNFMPLIAVALIYLVIVLILTRLVGLLERRLRKSDH